MTGWSRRPQAWVAVAACLVAWSASVTASGAVPTGAAPVVAGALQDRGTSLRVLQMNLCDSGAARCYTGRSVVEAGEVIRAQSPDVVTVNEVCRDDVPVLEDALGDAGGDGVVVSAFQAAWDRRTGASVRCRNGRPYGIALVARLPSPDYEAVGGAYPMQDPGSVELRAWLCLHPRAATPTAVTVCTTHLASGSAAAAGAQCGYLVGTAIPAVRARAGAVPVILGGDLNLRSDDPSTRCLPAGHRTDDGQVQHVVATPELVVGTPRTIAMPATDHPGLLVVLTREGRP